MVYIARRFENTGINIEDLISIGTIGLIKAVGTYQPAKKIKLATYASRCIENEILMHLRKTAGQKSEVPFDEPLSTDGNGNELLLSDILGTESDLVVRPMEEDADRQVLSQALATLPDREREIITLRFGLGGRQEHTQKEVADRLGISQSYISRLEKRIITRLKKGDPEGHGDLKKRDVLVKSTSRFLQWKMEKVWVRRTRRSPRSPCPGGAVARETATMTTQPTRKAGRSS